MFIDNDSSDKTRDYIWELCNFNAKNFGQFNSPYYGLCQTTGDCVIGMCFDFQDPVEMILCKIRRI